MVAKLKMFVRQSPLDSYISLEGDTHVVGSVQLLKMLIFDLFHLILVGFQLSKISSLQNVGTLFSHVEKAAIIEAEVHVDDVCNLYAIHLCVYLLYYTLLEQHDGRLSLIINQAGLELPVDLRVKLSLGRVVIDSHELQVKQFVIDLVLVKHLSYGGSEDNHHENANAGCQ